MIIGWLSFLFQPPFIVLVYFHKGLRNIQKEDRLAKIACAKFGSDPSGYIISRASQTTVLLRGK